MKLSLKSFQEDILELQYQGSFKQTFLPNIHTVQLAGVNRLAKLKSTDDMSVAGSCFLH